MDPLLQISVDSPLILRSFVALLWGVQDFGLTLLSVTEHNDGDEPPPDPQGEEFASWREAREYYAFEFWSDEHELDRRR